MATTTLELEKLKLQIIILCCDELRFNPNHDPKTGRFGFGSGAGDGFKRVQAKRFQRDLDAAKASQRPRDAWRVDNYSHSESDYAKDKLFVTEKGSTVAVTPDGDIISVCKHMDDDFRGSDLIQKAVENGGVKLDSFSGNHGFYVKNGFEPVSWCKFDEQYAPPGWKEVRGKKEPIIFYKYTGKTSNYTEAADFTSSVKASKDYDTAQAVRDKSIEKGE